MSNVKKFFTFVLVALLFCLPRPANAQSDVRTAEEKITFPQMDPVLYGMWAGHPGENAGMRFDPQAIACMVRACRTLREAFPRDIERWRDSQAGVFQACYAEHLQRVHQPGYTRLQSPPSMTSLVCSAIDTQKASEDDAIYASVNGHARPRPQPPAAGQPAPASRQPKVRLSADESRRLYAELDGLTAHDNPNGSARHAASAQRAPAVAGQNPHPRSRSSTTIASKPALNGGLNGFEIISISADDVALRILPGASHYTLERSFLANEFETSSLAVMTYERNNRTQIFFPFHLKDGKVKLYQPRVQLKPNDVKRRLGALDAATLAFMSACQSGDCEARFALQAGETLRLPRKHVSDSPVASAANQTPATSATDKPAEAAPVPPTSASAETAPMPPLTAASVDSAPTSSPSPSAANSTDVASQTTPPAPVADKTQPRTKTDLSAKISKCLEDRRIFYGLLTVLLALLASMLLLWYRSAKAAKAAEDRQARQAVTLPSIKHPRSSQWPAGAKPEEPQQGQMLPEKKVEPAASGQDAPPVGGAAPKPIPASPEPLAHAPQEPTPPPAGKTPTPIQNNQPNLVVWTGQQSLALTLPPTGLFHEYAGPEQAPPPPIDIGSNPPGNPIIVTLRPTGAIIPPAPETKTVGPEEHGEKPDSSPEKIP